MNNTNNRFKNTASVAKTTTILQTDALRSELTHADVEIAVEKNNTIFPHLPIELMKVFEKLGDMQKVRGDKRDVKL